MKNFVQPGNTISVTAPPGGVTSGDGVLIGNIFGVAGADAPAGTSVGLVTVGVFDLLKLNTDTIGQGQRVYWDAEEQHITEVATGNYPVGVATEAAGNGTFVVRVRLDGISTAPAA